MTDVSDLRSASTTWWGDDPRLDVRCDVCRRRYGDALPPVMGFVFRREDGWDPRPAYKRPRVTIVPGPRGRGPRTTPVGNRENLPKVLHLECRRCSNKPRVKRSTLIREAEDAVRRGVTAVYV